MHEEHTPLRSSLFFDAVLERIVLAARRGEQRTPVHNNRREELGQTTLPVVYV